MVLHKKMSSVLQSAKNSRMTSDLLITVILFFFRGRIPIANPVLFIGILLQLCIIFVNTKIVQLKLDNLHYYMCDDLFMISFLQVLLYTKIL